VRCAAQLSGIGIDALIAPEQFKVIQTFKPTKLMDYSVVCNIKIEGHMLPFECHYLNFNRVQELNMKFEDNFSWS